jgi:hypothetical protein
MGFHYLNFFDHVALPSSSPSPPLPLDISLIHEGVLILLLLLHHYNVTKTQLQHYNHTTPMLQPHNFMQKNFVSSLERKTNLTYFPDHNYLLSPSYPLSTAIYSTPAVKYLIDGHHLLVFKIQLMNFTFKSCNPLLIPSLALIILNRQ